RRGTAMSGVPRVPEQRGPADTAAPRFGVLGPVGFSSHSGLLDYERGRRIPPENLVAAYEREFGITTGYLRALRERALRERAEEMVGTLIDRYGPADSGQAASARTAGRPPPAGFVPRLAHTVLALPGCMAAAVRAAWHVSGEPDRP
ncbi:hypothetical protein, partial [Streptomyces minutiscleroticus]|uniref:hypothetical protein n=1 Tax=Streptomyces minutiscleroticus TaxID=68238 RepID=UPI0033298539